MLVAVDRRRGAERVVALIGQHHARLPGECGVTRGLGGRGRAGDVGDRGDVVPVDPVPDAEQEAGDQDAQHVLARGVHRDAKLECLAHGGGLHARANTAPERRVEQDDVHSAVQHICGKLLEIHYDRVGRKRDAQFLARAAHPCEAEDRILEVVVVQIFNRSPEADSLLGRPDAVGVESENFESLHNHSAYALIENDKTSTA